VSARNHKAIFERLVQPADLFTGEAGQWEEVCQEWVSLRPQTAREYIDAAQVTGQRPSIARLICSASTAKISTDCRMTIDGRTFEITSIVNVSETNHELELMVTERT
jgi:head-tail adaptor